MMRNLYNNKCFVMVRSAALELMRACDGSLEPSCYKNDHVMGENLLTRAVLPQCAKMCILLHKAVLNGCFEACIANMNCR